MEILKPHVSGSSACRCDAKEKIRGADDLILDEEVPALCYKKYRDGFIFLSSVIVFKI